MRYFGAIKTIIVLLISETANRKATAFLRMLIICIRHQVANKKKISFFLVNTCIFRTSKISNYTTKRNIKMLWLVKEEVSLHTLQVIKFCTFVQKQNEAFYLVFGILSRFCWSQRTKEILIH